jgi:hypothetical protein
MLTDADLAQMQSDLAEVVTDREVEVTIRRGATTLDPQAVRLARKSSGSRRRSEASSETRGSVVVVGGVDFDVQPGDRFNANGLLFQVTFVRPNRDAAVVADAELIE